LVGRDCEWEREGTDFFTEGEALFCLGAPSVDFEMKATVAGINYTSASAQAASLVSVQDASASASYATITGPKPRPFRLRLDLNASGVFGTGATFRAVRIQQGYWDIDAEVKGSTLFPGSSPARVTLFSFSTNPSNIVQGRVKLSFRNPGGDAAPTGLGIPSTTFCTVRFLEVEFEGLLQAFSANATDSNYAPWVIDATNIENVLIRHAMHSIATNTGKAYPRRPLKQRVITTTATLNGWDELVVCNPAAGFTVTLPNVAAGGASYGINPGEGGQHTIVDGNNTATANNITVACGGSDTFVDGTTSKVINTNGGVLRVVAAGGKWAVV
jgi:hypothetical protein